MVAFSTCFLQLLRVHFVSVAWRAMGMCSFMHGRTMIVIAPGCCVSCLGVGAGVHENLPSFFPPQVFIAAEE